MTAPQNVDSARQRRKWWRLYVHKIQKKYAIFVGTIVLVYGFLILCVAVLGPYTATDPAAGEDFSQYSLSERLSATAEFLLLGSTTWPAIISIFIPAAVIFTLYMTHRFAGPLNRLEQAARELGKGNLTIRIRLRDGDDLQELAGTLNAALINVDQCFAEVRDREAVERKVLRRCRDMLQRQPTADQELLGHVERALHEGEQVDAVFERFRLSAGSQQESHQDGVLPGGAVEQPPRAFIPSHQR